jgi:hypothetical protein
LSVDVAGRRNLPNGELYIIMVKLATTMPLDWQGAWQHLSRLPTVK